MVRSLIASSLGVMSQKALFPTPMDTISAMRTSGRRYAQLGPLCAAALSSLLFYYW